MRASFVDRERGGADVSRQRRREQIETPEATNAVLDYHHYGLPRQRQPAFRNIFYWLKWKSYAFLHEFLEGPVGCWTA